MHYLKFQIPFNIIRSYLEHGTFNKIIFHVDLASISRGFFNKSVVEYEISQFIETRRNPTIFLNESKEFFKKLWEQFKQYSPRFIIFYDDGECKQNKAIFNGYKDRSNDSSKLMLDDLQEQQFRLIKQYYYNEFPSWFNIANLSKVIYFREYEADFIPWVAYQNNVWNCADSSTLNIILSTDKDLLQCCQFGNFIQILTLYSKKESKILFNVYNDQTAIGQIYKNFERGILTSQYIPLILAIGGDKADKIPGIIKGIGDAGAYKMIINNKLPPQINSSTQLSSELEPFRKTLIRNYKLISFEEQLKRIPLNVLENLKKELLS